jgi:hypothetical protein
MADHYFREPMSAALIAAAATIAYIHIRASLNNEKALPNSSYFKPAFLVGLLVYIIVHQGHGHQESISTTPFRA